MARNRPESRQKAPFYGAQSESRHIDMPKQMPTDTLDDIVTAVLRDTLRCGNQ